MKIKNKLLISYLSVIIIILGVTVYISFYGLKDLESKNIDVARKGVEDIVNENFKLSQNILSLAGEKFVIFRGERVSLQLQLILEKNKDLLPVKEDGKYDYSLFRKDKAVREIITKDIVTPGRLNIVAGYIDLLDIHGEAVIHPNPDVEGKNYKIWEDEFPEMWKLTKDSFTKDQVFGYYSFLDKQNKPVKKFMALKRVKGTPLIVSTVVEIDKYFVPIHEKIRGAGEKIKNEIDEDITESSEKTLSELKIYGILIVIGLFVFGIILALWQAESTSRPIRDLSAKVRKIGEGDFSVTVLEKGSVELKELAASFNTLGKELAEYILNLKKETAAREAIESEIKIARQIQESLLPHSFPPFPEKAEFDLFALLLPAKDVSGDFYDFFFVDDKNLALIIADVSGKGLPAAIFMAVTRTLLRNLCLNSKGKSPDEILTTANKFLCLENDEAMFVTTFLAYYNIESGNMVYANAGHNPFVSLKGEQDAKELGLLSDFPMGIVDDHLYSKREYNLNDDEIVVFYTDGVSDAVSPDGEFYGTERFYSFIEKNRNNDIQKIINSLKDEVLEFQDEHQFDDVTLMMLKKNPTIGKNDGE